jgi:hypothetical protein
MPPFLRRKGALDIGEADPHGRQAVVAAVCSWLSLAAGIAAVNPRPGDRAVHAQADWDRNGLCQKAGSAHVAAATVDGSYFASVSTDLMRQVRIIIVSWQSHLAADKACGLCLLGGSKVQDQVVRQCGAGLFGQKAEHERAALLTRRAGVVVNREDGKRRSIGLSAQHRLAEHEGRVRIRIVQVELA